MTVSFRSWLEPDQQFAVAEIADLSAAFASALAKGEVAGQAAARVQDQQSWMPRGWRVHLEGDVAVIAEIGQRRAE